MDPFVLTEEKALLFHRALLSVAGEHANIVVRARAEVDRLRTMRPAQSSLWDRWAGLLDLSVAAMAPSVLADTPDGGLLRAHSPLGAALSASERNAIWQRVGLVQFIGFYFDAAHDLGLSGAEQARLTGIDEAVLTGWAALAPLELAKDDLNKLKQVLSLQSSLRSLAPERDVRRRWLRVASETLGGTPLALMLDGEMARVMEHLTGAAQLALGPGDYPSM